ncbi:trehalose-phosphatase [Taklimakanibacter lacteus]|uniref:trehalose-phosphatase n=1 Tax=Taklimakanibacter lacteus TaxID=2268456 RepID=UPI0013C51FE7
MRHALFLDFDGTLVDIAESPSAIAVPAELPALLMRMQIFLGGAVAIVSGRPLADLASYLAPADLDFIAEHGAVVKRRGQSALVPEQAWPESWHARLRQFTADHPATEVERKSSSIVLHFRRAPEAERAAFDLVSALAKGAGGFEILPAKMAFELKPASMSKGKAITALMAEEPYRHRIPVFAGDDVTDEDGFAAVAAMGGMALRVDASFGGATARVRAWLAGEIGMQGVVAA